MGFYFAEFTSDANDSTTSTVPVYQQLKNNLSFFLKMMSFFISLVQLLFPQPVVLTLQVSTHYFSTLTVSFLLCP